MNTIPRKIRRQLYDILIGAQNIVRQKPLTLPQPKNIYKSLEDDFEALDQFCYFLLGTSLDGLLDIIYEDDVPKNYINPFLTMTMVTVTLQIPATLVFVEVMGAVPGMGNVYSYAYIGLNELSAFIGGWIWIGAAAARQAALLHYFALVITRHFPKLEKIHLVANAVGVFSMIFLPLASNTFALNVNSVAVTAKVTLILFLLGFTNTQYWFVPQALNHSSLSLSTFLYYQLYFAFPIVAPVIQKITRRKILLKKMIALTVLASFLQVFFFVVMTGNVPFTEESKHWVEKLIGPHRSRPYSYFFHLAHFFSCFSSIFAVQESTCILIEQMSSDGLLFNYLSNNDYSRKFFFVFLTVCMFVGGFENCRGAFIILSSFGIALVCLYILFVRTTGVPGFYIKRSNVQRAPRARDHIILVAVKSVLIFVLIGCLLGSFVSRKVFIVESFSGSTYEFAMLFICIFFVLMGLFILIVTPKHHSVFAPIKCPLGPLLPVMVMLGSTINLALGFFTGYVEALVWVSVGFIFYILFGLRSVTNNRSGEGVNFKRNVTDQCHEDAHEELRIFEILSRRLKKDEDQQGYLPKCPEFKTDSKVTSKEKKI